VNTLPAIKCALILLSVCCLSACNQEKAQALQLAATTFSNEADRACKMGADSLQAAVAMPALTRSDIATSLAQAKKFGATELDLIYADNSITDSANAPALTALNQACEAHRQLAAMYTDLPRGYLLATDEVKKRRNSWSMSRRVLPDWGTSLLNYHPPAAIIFPASALSKPAAKPWPLLTKKPAPRCSTALLTISC
jgi:hypothetical protein